MMPPREHGKSFTSLQYWRILLYLLLTFSCPKHFRGQKGLLKVGGSAEKHSMKSMLGLSDYQKETNSLTYLILEFVIQTIGHLYFAKQNQTL